MANQLNESKTLQCSVLVLNKAYVPVHVVSARRSIVLLYRELAEVIHIEDGTVTKSQGQSPKLKILR